MKLSNNVDILIMDDKDEKINILRNLLTEECNIDPTSISCARTINEGRGLLRHNFYDLLLLDLVMPNLDGEEPNNEDAPRFIDEIYENRDICLPNQILGLTAHDDEFDKLKQRFEDKLWSLIKFSSGSIDWKVKVRSKVNHLKHSKERLKNSILLKNKYDIGIICALNEEFEEMKTAFKGEWTSSNIEQFPLSVYSKKIMSATGKGYSICAICMGEAGLISASAVAAMMINIFHLDYIFMTGFAAGFPNKNLKFGDIVVSKSIGEPIVGKVTETEDLYRLNTEIHNIVSDNDLLSKAQHLSSNYDFLSEFNKTLYDARVRNEKDMIQISIGPTVSVPFVVGSSKLMTNIQDEGDRKLLALDMEGYGMYKAASMLKVPCLWMKAISDLGDEHKDDSYHRNCSYASAFFLYKLIKEEM